MTVTGCPEIRAEAVRRGVRRIVHFTNLVNLYGMWRAGFILSRQRLGHAADLSGDVHALDAVDINDKRRLDQCTDHINCSLDVINARLLQRFKADRRVQSDQWCIVCIRMDHLWRQGTVFSVGNAASNQARRIGIRGGLIGFRAIFCGDDGPLTFPQSEVLIRGTIPVSDITGVLFENEDDRGSAAAALPEFSNGRDLPEMSTVATAFTGDR
jgi:hypothetical protein